METLRFLGWQPHWSIVTAAQAPFANDASLDMVISDGDIANWEQTLDGSNRFKDVFRALKKGGVLGVIEVRARDGTSFVGMMMQRAVTEAHVVLLAEVAGFRLVSRSNINAGAWPARMTLKFVKP